MIGYARAGLCGVGSFFIFLGGLLQINRIYNEDCLETMKRMPDEFVNCVVTSPPYWGLRDYGVNGQIGLEKTPELYVEKMVEIFSEIKRVLKPDGTLWLILGDSYNGAGENRQGLNSKSFKIGKHEKANHGLKRDKYTGLKSKDLVGIPWRVAFALQADGWYLRSDIIWHKPNPMPESVTDRPTKSHEYIFLLTKSKKYYYDFESIKEPYTSPLDRWGGETVKEYNGKFSGYGENSENYGSPRARTQRKPKAKSLERNRNMRPDPKGKNKRSVWTVNTCPFPEAHFAVFPPELIVDCVKAGCPKNGIVYDPFGGSGTTAEIALRLDRNYVLNELNPEYCQIAERRISSDKCRLPLFGAGQKNKKVV